MGGRCLGDRIAHLAGRGVREVANRVDCFMRGASGDDDVLSREIGRGAKPSERCGDDLVNLGEFAGAGVAASKPAGRGPNQEDAAGLKGLGVLLGGGILPHMDIHGRSHDYRTGACQKRSRNHVVGDAIGHLRHDVGGCRSDEGDIRPPCQLDVRNRRGAFEYVEINLVTSEGFESLGADEFRSRLGHCNADFATVLLQPTQNFAGFI